MTRSGQFATEKRGDFIRKSISERERTDGMITECGEANSGN
jgi:hypothetical protein